ncbi:flagellar basal body rod protein FlgB [Bosea sp. BH3]|uniref:flagellar basal body rod protein FlgB n=1 Tax=Bosea sp. BH3 TaxID=2871701 RepID=UPI0021CAFBB5|nr:flagellar basal body rod protein FlgB [Bosea sp. BH3]MCU4180602.1 flagellar basal body rod protein FlgB [Bosea sp. BH3]
MADDGLRIGGGLMQALKTRMYYQQSRQKVLAENVANSDSPGFRPVDLKPPSVDPNRAGVHIALTRPGHLQLDTANGGFDSTGAPRFETTPNGNAVNLEDEMLKVAQNQSDYQLAASLYSKGLGLMKIAIGKGR